MTQNYDCHKINPKDIANMYLLICKIKHTVCHLVKNTNLRLIGWKKKKIFNGSVIKGIISKNFEEMNAN